MEEQKKFIILKVKSLLEKNNELTIPAIFEYFSAYKMCEEYKENFNVWGDISPDLKEKNNFPNNDMGVDIANENFYHLGQCKYYQNSTITWRKLCTFLSFPTLTDVSENLDNFIKHHKLHLLRSENSKCSKLINNVFKAKNLTDNILNEKEFRDFIEMCKNYVCEPKKIEDEFELRKPQIDAIEMIKKSERNVIVQLPTGVGKTHVALSYIKENKDKKFLVLVPTIAIGNDWYKKALKIGLENIYKVYTGYYNVFPPEDFSIIICVYNSFDVVSPRLYEFSKVIVDEAHHILPSKIYKDIKMENDSFLMKIREQVMKNINSILLSATIDTIKDFNHFYFSLREAIDQKFICDYQIICPIFESDPDDRNIIKYIIKKGETHCIVYTATIAKAKAVKKIFNELLPGCCEEINCNTPESERERTLRRFENGEFRFLVNVNILGEGVDLKIASSCLFLHLPSNEIRIVQSIGRTLRLHEEKKVANCYIPYSNENDGKSIESFFKCLGRNDEKIKKCLALYKIGSYINIEMADDENLNEEQNEEIDLRYELVYDSMGKNKNCLKLLEYVDKFQKVPRYDEIYEGVYKLGSFWGIVKCGYYKNLYDSVLSKNDILRNDYNNSKIKKENTLTPEEKADLLLIFVENYGRIPKKKEIYENFTIGDFWQRIAAENGSNKKFYNEKLCENEILRNDYERRIKKRENKIDRIPFLIDFVEKEKRAPSYTDTYQGVEIGKTWRIIKNGKAKNGVYVNILCKYDILKNDYEGNPDAIAPEEKCDILLDYITKFNKMPLKDTIYRGLNIHSFWRGIRGGHNKDLYDTILSKNDFLREKYEQPKKNQKDENSLSPEQKIDILIDYVTKFNKMPKKKLIYEKVNLYLFWTGLRRGNHKQLCIKKFENNKFLWGEYTKEKVKFQRKPVNK